MGLWYSKDSGFELIADADADHAGCNDDCKSTSGGIQFLGEKLVSWSSKKQDCTTMSSAEAEYVSLSACCAQVIWMRTQLLDYGFRYLKIMIYYDSQSTIELYFVGMEYQLADLFTKALPKERFEFLVHKIGDQGVTPKLTTIPVSTEEPIGKSKRVKRPTKKSTKALARGVVIRETPEMPLSKKKEKVDVTRGKGIELLSEVALAKDAQFEEVQRKSMRDFYKTHPSGSGTITKPASSAEIIPSVTNEGTGVKPGVPDVMEDESSERSDQERDSGDDKSQSDIEKGSDSEHETDENESGFESDQDENEEDIGDDEEEIKDEFVKTSSNNFDNEDETKITDKAEGDEDEEMDYTTSQLYNDVDIRLNEPVDTDKGFAQEEGTDVAMINIQQGDENSKILQVIEDANVTLITVPQKTKVPITSSSHLSDLAANFLNFSDIPHTDAEVVSLMDVHFNHEVLSQQTPKLLTVPVSVISDSSPVFSTVIPQSLPSFTPPPQQSTSTPPPTSEATNPPSTLPDFAPVF
ncbi:hypothetical protein Tco_1173990 [Tanacetum coccineum]